MKRRTPRRLATAVTTALTTVLATVLATVLVATLLLVGPRATADPFVDILPGGGDADQGVVPMIVGTYNFRAERPLKKFKKAIDELKERVMVAGLQEIAQKEKNDHLQADEGWDYYRPDELRQNPVIWDTRVFEYADAPQAGYRLAKGRTIEDKDGGTEYKEPTFATLVRLDHLVSGNEISVVNVHLLSGASRVGLPWPGRPKRFDMLCDQIRGLVRLVRSEVDHGNEVFVVGDFNVGFQADVRNQHKKMPYRRFKRVDLRSIWQGGDLEKKGTFDKSYLDQIWAENAASRREVARDIKGSDHYPAIGTYLLDVEIPMP